MLEELREYREEIEYSHLDISSKEIIEKYGILQGPAVIINDILVSQGKIPSVKSLKKKFQKVLEK